MGFMAEGNTLGWADAAKHAEYIRQHGIQQLLSIYNKYKDRKNDRLQWGDEVCYFINNQSHPLPHPRFTLHINSS
jgi:glutamate--cysteine ligase catalytic subunit